MTITYNLQFVYSGLGFVYKLFESCYDLDATLLKYVLFFVIWI